MTAASMPVDASTRDVLRHAIVDGHAVRLPAQLDRRLYQRVDKVLQALGGKWDRRAGAHLFPTDPTDTLAAVVAGGSAPAPARTGEGYVATPGDLAAALCRYPYANLATLPRGSRILEPSAGDGPIVHAIVAATAARAEVWAVEPNPARTGQLAASFLGRKWTVAAGRSRIVAPGTDLAGSLTIAQMTTEEFAANEAGRFDAVVMNPPFAVPGQPTLWIDHLRLAWGLIAPTGRLVCVAPHSLTYRQDRRHNAIRDLVEAHGWWDELDVDAFRPSGVRIKTVVVVMDKPVLVDDLAELQDAQTSGARQGELFDLATIGDRP